MGLRSCALGAALLALLAVPAFARVAHAQPASPAGPQAAPQQSGPQQSGPQQAGPQQAGAPQDGAQETRGEAFERFGRGVDLYREGNFGAALTEFSAAYALSPTYKVLYNIGQVQYQLQDYVEASRAFELFLEKGGAEISASRRTEVEQVLATLRTRVSKLEIASSVAGARVTIDDRPIGVSPLTGAISVNVGRHKVTATKQGYAELTRFADVAGNTTEHLQMDLLELAPQAQVRADVPSPAPSPPAASRMTTLSWIGVGAAGALAVAATVTGIEAVAAKGTLDDRPPSDPATPDSRTRVRTFALATDVLAGAALVTLGTTLAVTFLVPRHDAGARVGVLRFEGVRVGLGGASAGWSF